MENPDKPLNALSSFAAKLGWSELRIYQHRYLENTPPAVTTWYESGQSNGLPSDFFLQINEAPQGQVASYVGAVYAMRYRLCSGWHRFTLRDTDDEHEAEAIKVDEWLHRRWYETLEMRRQFRKLHPECDGYSWGLIRSEGPPYLQDGAAAQ